ncbi:MAG: thiamine pyrophosphate-dependent enzyme [Terracidiphilus sp.]
MKAGNNAEKSPEQGAEKKFSLIPDAKLRAMYVAMQKCRMLAEHYRALPRKDRPAVAMLHRGHEAMLAALTTDLKTDDALSLASEEAAAGFLKGLTLAAVLRKSKKTESMKTQTSNHVSRSFEGLLPSAASTAAQLHMACGVALAWKARVPGKVVAVFCGGADAPASSWKEVLTFASDHQLPLVLMTHEANDGPSQFDAMAKSALVHGVPMLTVDGRDAVAVYRVVFESLVRARQGRGATLIVCRTDLKGHGQPRDPLRRMEAYLMRKGLYPSAQLQQAMRAFQKRLSSAAHR